MQFLLLLLLFSALSFAAPKSVTLTEDLVIGGSDAPDIALFSATAKLAVAANGTLYVLDSGNFRISTFNDSGTFLFQFGRQGKGPGEFIEPVAIGIDPDQNLWVFDTGQHKYIVYNAKGDYQREQRFPTNVHGVFTPAIFPNGHYAITAYRINEAFQITYELAIQNNKAEDVASFRAYAVPKIEWEQMEQPGFWRNFLKDQFVAIASEMPLSARVGDRLLILEKQKYEAEIVDANGKLLTRFEGDYKPRALSDEAKYALCEPIWQDLAANPALSPGLTTKAFTEALNEMDELQVTPPVAAVTSMGDLFVVLTSYDPLSRTGTLDFRDAEGTLVGRGDYKGTHQFLTGIKGFLYSVGYNADEDVVITRYKVEGL